MRVQSPIAGGQSGSLGGLTFQHYHGRTYARSKPAIFHYGPTPAQRAAQNKYYSLRGPWLALYRSLRPYFPTDTRDGRNYYNLLQRQIYTATRIFDAATDDEPLNKIEIDARDRIRVRCGNYDLYLLDNIYYITFEQLHFETDLDFYPTHAHAIFVCQETHEFFYEVVDYIHPHLSWPFNNSLGWFPSRWFDMYIALGNDEFLSNFYY